jgi:hypothetical protein
MRMWMEIIFNIAYFILRDARTAHDRPFTWIGIMILLSYAFYIPVILYMQEIPVIGMLMIPKTMACVGIGLIAYFSLFKKREDSADTLPAMAD